jgi:hypothetical protein
MRKSTLILALLIGLMTSRAFATVTVTGTSGNVDLSSTNVFNTTISLAISGPPPANVESLNLLLMTPTSGVHSGVPYFTVYVNSLVSPFSAKNSASDSSNTSSFTTAGTGPNAGFTVTPSSLDLGANTGAPVTIPAGGATFGVDTLTFTLAPNTPAGVYNFSATLGGFADANGSWVDDSANTTFDVSNAPTFTITVVPEPGTWSLVCLGGVAFFGLNVLRRRRIA